MAPRQQQTGYNHVKSTFLEQNRPHRSPHRLLFTTNSQGVFSSPRYHAIFNFTQSILTSSHNKTHMQQNPDSLFQQFFFFFFTSATWKYCWIFRILFFFPVVVCCLVRRVARRCWCSSGSEEREARRSSARPESRRNEAGGGATDGVSDRGRDQWEGSESTWSVFVYVFGEIWVREGEKEGINAFRL